MFNHLCAGYQTGWWHKCLEQLSVNSCPKGPALWSMEFNLKQHMLSWYFWKHFWEFFSTVFTCLMSKISVKSKYSIWAWKHKINYYNYNTGYPCCVLLCTFSNSPPTVKLEILHWKYRRRLNLLFSFVLLTGLLFCMMLPMTIK